MSIVRSWFPPDESRALLRLAGPILLGMASQALVNLVDTAMVGSLGPAAQGAVGLSSFAFWVVANLVLGVGTAVQATAARREGEGDHEAAGAALDSGLVLVVLLGVPLGIVLSQGADAVMPWLSDDPEVQRGGGAYLAIRVAGMGVVAANYAFRGFWNGIGRSSVYLSSLLVIHASNVALNWLLIFGHLGAPALGVRGAALASVGAAATGTIFYTAMTWIQRPVRERYRPLRLSHATPPRLLALLRLMVPEGARGIVLMCSYLLLQRLHAALGTREVAAGTILVNLASAGFLPALGMGMACATFVGQALGRGAPDDARRATWLGVRLATALALAPALVLALAPGPVLAVFTRDALVIDIARPALRLLAASTLLDPLAMVLVFALLGAGATRFGAMIQVLQQYVISLPLAWLLGIHLDLGVPGFWLALLVSRVAVAGIAARKLRGDSWTTIAV